MSCGHEHARRLGVFDWFVVKYRFLIMDFVMDRDYFREGRVFLDIEGKLKYIIFLW